MKLFSSGRPPFPPFFFIVYFSYNLKFFNCHHYYKHYKVFVFAKEVYLYDSCAEFEKELLFYRYLGKNKFLNLFKLSGVLHYAAE